MERHTRDVKSSVRQSADEPLREDLRIRRPPEAKAQLYELGKLRTATLVADPSITIIEVGEAVGVLLAEGCYETQMNTRLHLEPVTWVRLEGGRVLHSRVLDEVLLYQHASNLYVAQDRASGQYLFCPSEEPYVVFFIAQRQLRKLQRAIDRAVAKQVLDSMESVIQPAPGFSFEKGSLSAPARYARAEACKLDHEIVRLG
jgi:hypothetical protein